MSPREIVDDMVARGRESGHTLTELKVPTEFFRQLCESLRADPSAHYGFPILIDKELDGAEEAEVRRTTLH